MQLISLNIWGGHVRDPLLKFVEFHQDVDIFCFQEVYSNASMKMSTDDNVVSFDIFERFQELLPNHRGFFCPVLWDVYGIAAFVKKGIDVMEKGHINIYENSNYPGRGPTHPRALQWLKCKVSEKIFTIMNVHGLWNGQGKTDSEDRIIQSNRIRDFMNTVDTPKILCGDFNLKPDTESTAIVAKGMNNLIQEYGITSTRTSLYDKDEKYADYVFTSPEVSTSNFEVWDDLVSDHAPLSLTFSINKDNESQHK